MSTARSSVVTSSRTSGYFSANAGGQLAHRGLREEQRRADPQPASRLVPARSDRRGRLVEFGEQCPRPLVKRPTFLGELQRARSALEQAQVEAALQFGDPAGQRRFRTSSGAGGPSEPSVTGDQIEIGEGKQIHVFHQ